MFSILGGRGNVNGASTRRNVIQVGALSSLGLGLPDFLKAQKAGKPGSMGSGRTFGQAKHCILLYMWGGPPHQDTVDLKPEAPLEVRGEFSPIPTTIPGIEISDHLPLLAGQADKFTILRSLTHNNSDHISQCHDMLTGNAYPGTSSIVTARPTDHPHIGAVLGALKPQSNQLPAYVQVPCILRSNSGKVIPGQHGGFLGRRHDPFLVEAVPNKLSLNDPEFQGFTPDNLQLRFGVSYDRMQTRKSLLESLSQSESRSLNSDTVQGFESYYQRAYGMVRSPQVREAFDLSKESSVTRDRYGRHTFGQGVLLARRLIEAGVPLTTVYWRNGPVRTDIGWDNHINNFPNLKNWQMPPVDRALATLLEDLAQSGLLDETLVVCMGEFGRTPKINENGGRDHWPYVFSTILAGGGIRGGEVFGSSDSQAAYPRNNPVTPLDLGATIYHLLGIDTKRTLHDQQGRPHPVCRGIPISGLI